MKNTIKIILTSLVLVLSFFAWEDEVYAAADCDKYGCAKCVYSNSYGTYTYDIKSIGDGSLSVDFKSDTTTGSISAINNVNSTYFKNSNTNKIECYPINTTISVTGRSIKVTLSAKDGQAKLEPTSESTNNDKFITEDGMIYKSCDYFNNMSTCTINATDSGMTATCTNGFTILNNELEVSDFGYGTVCATASLKCSSRGGKYCSLLKPSSIGSGSAQQGTETESGSDINGSGIISLEPEFGIYCRYKDGFYFKYSGFSKEDLFHFDTNFDTYGTGIAIEYGRPGKRFDDAEETAWLKSKGLIDENGYFVCPVDPFGSQLGEAIEKGCGPSDCNILDIESAYQSYTCNYTGQTSGKNLQISHICEAESCHWEITYPDGTSKTLGLLEGALFPDSNCDDIYYTFTDRKINTAIFGVENGEEVNLTLKKFCNSNGQSDIEHFCSGTCDYPETSCTIFDDYCSGTLDPLLPYLEKIFTYIRIAAPIALIIFGCMDFAGPVLSDDRDALKKATSKFTKRCIALIAIFFAPTVLQFILSAFNRVTGGNLSTCGLGMNAGMILLKYWRW